MKKIHQIGDHWKKNQVKILADIGILVEEGTFSYIQVEPDQFDLIKTIVMSNRPVHSFGAVFDKVDMSNAEWLALTGLGTFGYPQPQLDFEIGMVYEVSNRCARCGLNRGSQRNSFRIKTDKTKLEAFQLEWIHDEIFVKKDLYDEVFMRLGIGFWQVLIHQTGKISENVVQLNLPECDWDFDLTGMRTEDCPVCGQSKYVVRPLDFLPPLNGTPPNVIFHGREFFGSGAQVAKRIYLSQYLRQQLLNRKIAKWHQFYPLKS